MTDSLRISGSGREINLYPWLGMDRSGVESLAGIEGFGLPDQENQWFDGAGSGSTWRGSRIKRRDISIPLWVYAADRAALTEKLSDLSVVLDPFTRTTEATRGSARLFFGMADGDEWFIDVVRRGRTDWARKIDSDDRTYFKTTISLEAGDAFWTRNRPEMFEIRRDTSGAAPTLLPRLAKLRLGSGAAFGVKNVNNVGDTYAWPVFRVNGPTTKVTLVGAAGERLVWSGALLLGQTLTIDMRNNTVTDQTGANRYDGLGAAPRFWSIAPGSSSVTVQADNIGDETTVNAQWWPRRWAVL